MKLGFIGTGKIASSVIQGISKSKINYKRITVSPRNKKVANHLKKRLKKIVIAKNNQEIINNSDWIFLCVTPIVGKRIIKDLDFKRSKIIISFISTINLFELK